MFNTPSQCNGCPELNSLDRTIQLPQAAAEAVIGRQIASILGDRIVLQDKSEIGPNSPDYTAVTNAVNAATAHAQQVEGRMSSLTNGCPGLQPGGICGNESS